MFHKLLRSESEEMALAEKVRRDYASIFDTLIDYLNENMEKFNKEIERDVKFATKGWNLLNDAAAKFRKLQVSQRPTLNSTAFAEFKASNEKWNV
jgi:hypothetical protein